ncbi:hypothetical protein SAMN05421852_11028 [Thermoflavimicrobium dichotomicum]|uniref:Uncharacterized protein n=1 Tax=Thermoflavimicrobium dichotomicum TaxID=46223 RepID=A0A1I3RIT2_9BACL|nr:hypothetical protein SAMN05421852_11028 [Thermoflavimicrobium dichotomicum]
MYIKRPVVNESYELKFEIPPKKQSSKMRVAF